MKDEKIIVLKFGGSSLKDSDCIKKVLDIIISRINSGYKTVVVVSARGKTTEALLAGFTRQQCCSVRFR